MGTILWRPYYRDLISIIKTTLWRSNYNTETLYYQLYRLYMIKYIHYEAKIKAEELFFT